MKHLNREDIKTRGILVLAGIFLLVIAAHIWWPDTQMIPSRSLSSSPAPLTPEATILNNIPIDLNTASQEELAAIPSLGATKAKAIVQFRNEKGSFKDVNSILDVPGVGPKTLEKTRAHLKVSDAGKKLN